MCFPVQTLRYSLTRNLNKNTSYFKHKKMNQLDNKIVNCNNSTVTQIPLFSKKLEDVIQKKKQIQYLMFHN